MPRHLNDTDLPQLTITSSTESPNLGTLLGSENFNSGTIGQDVESPNSFLTDAFPWGHITFEAGGYTGQKAFAAASGDHYLEHSLGGSFPAWRDAATVDIKFKVDSLPIVGSGVRLGGFENAPGEDYVFGITNDGTIGIGYVTPNPATKTVYSVSPEEWVRVVFTYQNNYTITLRLFHGDNINGTVPDETISRQGSYQNVRYLMFGKRDDWSNNVAVSYDDLYLYHGVPDWNTTLPQRTGLQFAGAGISSMVDNPSTSSTDIVVANNPSATEFEGGMSWEKTGLTISSAGALDLGVESQNLGSDTWFDAGASDLPNGEIHFAEQGLYSMALYLFFNGDAPYTYDPEDLFSIVMRLYNPDLSLRYDVNRPVLQIKKEDGGSDRWGCSISVTDVMEVGSYLLFWKYTSDQVRSRSGVTCYTTIRKFV